MNRKVKMMSVVGCMFMLWTVSVVRAQPAMVTKLKSIIAPLRLTIGEHKTTNLIFPYSIVSVDRGSKEVLVQKAKGVENILQVKAASDSLQETNLTAITADGSLYSFLLEFAREPLALNLNLALSDAASSPVGVLPIGYDNEAKMRGLAEKVAMKQTTLNGLRSKEHAISLQVGGIYIEEGNLFFQLSIENSSPLRYDIDQLRFFIRDQKRTKRTAFQELEQRAIYVHGTPGSIGPLSTMVLVYVFPQFTIPDKKELILQLMEKNGGRHLQIKVKNKKLLRSKAIR